MVKIVLCMIAIIVAGFSLAVLRRWHRKPAPKEAFVQARVGDTVCRPDGGAWSSRGSVAFIIVTSPTCGACEIAKDFSEEVFLYGQAHKMPVFYVVPSRPESDAGARDLRNKGREVLRENLRNFGIQHLPTYVRVDHKGVIESMWTGTVSAENHDDVFASIVSSQSLEQYGTMTGPEFTGYLAKRPDLQLLGLSEIGKRPKMKILPFEELGVRAKYELDRARPVAIDCGTAVEPWMCQDAGMLLVKEKFKDVVVVDLERRKSTCAQ